MRQVTRNRIERGIKGLESAAEYAEIHEPFGDDLARELAELVEQIRDVEARYHAAVNRGGPAPVADE